MSVAAGYASLLEEADDTLRTHALENLNQLAERQWTEIRESVGTLEALAGTEYYEHRALASLVAAKVLFFGGQYERAMRHALAAGPLLDVREGSLFMRSLVGKCLDEYLRQRRLDDEARSKEAVPYAGLERLMAQIVVRAEEERDWRGLVGLGLDFGRLDLIDLALNGTSDPGQLLDYCYDLASRATLATRPQTVDLLRKVLSASQRLLAHPDPFRVSEILTFLGEADSLKDVLLRLTRAEASDEEVLAAYQIAFDTVDAAPQKFRLAVRAAVRSAMTLLGGGEKRVQRLDEILSGKLSILLKLQFLHRCNRTDRRLQQQIKAASESRSSITYTGVVVCNAFMNAGTTSDAFLRDNMEWLAQASSWARFTATAGIGVIQQGHWNKSMAILEPYLPNAAHTHSPYSAGGALFALGLINANLGEVCLDYLLRALKEHKADPVVVHGACLGIGVAAMGTRDPSICEQLMEVVYEDDANAAEAAGIALGLVQLGSNLEDSSSMTPSSAASASSSSYSLDHLLTYMHETKHEKIIRGVAMGVALTLVQAGEAADSLIEQLRTDSNPTVRYGGMYAIALAYAGTADNRSIRTLLHVAVSDVSDDVRMAAVIGLGFLLFNQPADLPRLLSLLSGSYNYHVRYAACVALGIACAGTGMPEALELLTPLLADSSRVVRQGAFLGLAMVLQEISPAQNPFVDEFRKKLLEALSARPEDPMSRFGAQLAYGILDASGRNAVLGLRTRTGHVSLLGVVGTALFCQYWYWHPMALFLSLAFQPTAVIGVTRELAVPQFRFRCQGPQDRFAYPKPVSTEPKKAAAPVLTAELSISRKARKRAAAKLSGSSSSAAQKAASAVPSSLNSSLNLSTEMDLEPVAHPPPLANKSSFVLANPARVTPLQRPALRFDADARYSPVKPAKDAYGIVLLRDASPNEPENLVVSTVDAHAAVTGALELASALSASDGTTIEDVPPEFDFDPSKE